MTTTAGTGASLKRDTTAAVGDALRRALSRIRGQKPAFALLFVSSDHDPRAASKAAVAQLGDIPILSATTAGEFTECGASHGGIAALVVASDTLTCRALLSRGLKQDPQAVAESLCKGVLAARRAAQAKNGRHLTSVLLTDGLAGTGEDLVLRLYERMGTVSQLVGGAAGDEGRFTETNVGVGAEVGNDAAAVLHVFGRTSWGIGVDHGLRPTTSPMRVTKAHRNVVYEIEGAPAFQVYERHAAERGTSLTRHNSGTYMIANEIGIHFFDRITRARAPLSVGSDGELTCAAAIPEGAMISILDGEPENMIKAARHAAQEAAKRLDGTPPAGVLLFDCVCRGMILKGAFQREIDAVRSVFGDVPVAGFLTYGEIARHQEQLEGWHNTTAVVAAIPAD